MRHWSPRMGGIELAPARVSAEGTSCLCCSESGSRVSRTVPSRELCHRCMSASLTGRTFVRITRIRVVSLLLFNWWSPFCGFFLPRDYHNELFFPPHSPCQASPALAKKLPCNECRNSHLFSLPRVPGSHTTIRVSSSFTAVRIICPETPCRGPAS